uniref:Uncharacterized protein n=1 Tax=viral metagenome TaxID=1070528 RepID=A0A6C0JZ86_9ZZZZ
MKTTTKVALALGALGVPLGVFAGAGAAYYGLPGKKNPKLKSASDVMVYITFITALPITIAAETLTIKYQKKKFLWLNTIPFALLISNTVLGAI